MRNRGKIGGIKNISLAAKAVQMTVGGRIHRVVSGFSHERNPSCPAPVQFAGALATDEEAKLLSDSRLPGTCYGYHPS